MEDKLVEIGLSIPEITALVHVLKDKGFPIEGEYYTVEEAAAAISEILK